MTIASQEQPPARVLVPRGGAAGRRLADAVRAAGHQPVVVPLISFAPPEDPAPLTEALTALCAGEFDWLLLTSERTVEALAEHPALADVVCAEPYVAAVGPTTARRAEELGLVPDVVPDSDRTARGLVAALARLGPAHALVPHSDLAGPELAEGLRAAGWDVAEVVAYRTLTARELPEGLDVDAVLLTSSSTARTWAALHPAVAADRPGPPPVVCIGPRTAETAGAAGLAVAAVAQDPQPEALVAALTTVLPTPRSRP